MVFNSAVWRLLLALSIPLIFSACGISKYPGQPGMITNGYSKIQLENLDVDGLFIYEVTYDNRANGEGVSAIVTKSFSSAKTFTTNVRTNADGTLYQSKAAYNGAKTELIVLPQQNQMIFAPDSKILLLLEYALSLDELDDKNIAEAMLFETRQNQPITERAFEMLKFRAQAIQMARWALDGTLSYTLTKAELGDETFIPSKAVLIQTNFLQNGLRTQIADEVKMELVEFIEAKFPKGFKGEIKLYLHDNPTPLKIVLGIQTPKTAENNGVRVMRNASQQYMNKILKQIRQ